MIAHIATMDSYPLSLACSHARMCVCVWVVGGMVARILRKVLGLTGSLSV